MNTILIRQSTDYHCGPASISTILSISGIEINKFKNDINIGDKIKCTPNIGVDGSDIKEFFDYFAPSIIQSEGESTYLIGEIAIANILNHHSGVGHFVVILDSDEQNVFYWDPILSKIIQQKWTDFSWVSGDGLLKKWSINFGFSFKRPIQEYTIEKRRWIIGDDEETLDIMIDTSKLIQDEYIRLGIKTSWHTPKQILVRNQDLYLSGQRVLEDDIVWIRSDPVNTVSYYEMLRSLCHVNTKFVNSPHGILVMHDKLSVMWIKSIDSFRVSNLLGLRSAIKQLQWIGNNLFVMKSPSSFGGDNIFFVDSDSVENVFLEIIHHSNYVIIEPDIRIPLKPSIDTRVFWVDGKIIAAINRISSTPESKCNLHQGAKVSPCSVDDIDPKIINDINEIGKKLQMNGIIFAGFDILNGCISEVNTSCPSVVMDYNKLLNENLERIIVKIIEDKL